MNTDKKTWFITGAGRGMGVDFAKAALAAGHNVVATGRNPEAIPQAVGDSDDLVVVTVDITSGQDAEAAARGAVDRFGGIDVLVNTFTRRGFSERTMLGSPGSGDAPALRASVWLRDGSLATSHR
jgi:NAD(P)-dependent dehydrogenase (short-subunit alcohol dehydrogenase family)